VVDGWTDGEVVVRYLSHSASNHYDQGDEGIRTFLARQVSPGFRAFFFRMREGPLEVDAEQEKLRSTSRTETSTSLPAKAKVVADGADDESAMRGLAPAWACTGSEDDDEECSVRCPEESADMTPLLSVSQMEARRRFVRTLGRGSGLPICGRPVDLRCTERSLPVVSARLLIRARGSIPGKHRPLL